MGIDTLTCCLHSHALFRLNFARGRLDAQFPAPNTHDLLRGANVSSSVFDGHDRMDTPDWG
jgi:hypothetical protein